MADRACKVGCIDVTFLGVFFVHLHQKHGTRTLTQVLLGRSEDPALLRATRVAGTVALILLLGVVLSRLLAFMRLLPDWLPFSWSGVGQELLAKSGGAFVLELLLVPVIFSAVVLGLEPGWVWIDGRKAEVADGGGI